MFGESLAAFVGTQRSRPLSVAVAIASLFLPGSLILFVARPALFFKLSFPTLVLLSASISLPIVILCFGILYNPLFVIRSSQRTHATQSRGADLVTHSLARDDPLEWPCLLGGSWLASVVLFLVATVAYYKSIRIGATMVLVAAILAAVWFLLTLTVTVVATIRAAGSYHKGAA